jgi:hypothetical protein
MWVSGNPLRSIPETTVHYFCVNMKGAIFFALKYVDIGFGEKEGSITSCTVFAVKNRCKHFNSVSESNLAIVARIEAGCTPNLVSSKSITSSALPSTFPLQLLYTNFVWFHITWCSSPVVLQAKATSFSLVFFVVFACVVALNFLFNYKDCI